MFLYHRLGEGSLDINIKKAALILQEGGLVAFPTETVYGLGADAANPAAVARIFTVKERPYTHPLIVHVSTIAEVDQWARDISPAARMVMQACWPGPLTLILKKQPNVLDSVTGGQDTIGLRIPKHPIAQQLLHAFGGGIAAPSANKFTHISPTTAAAVQSELGGEIECILDGGSCEVGLESTILDLSADEPVILRPGMMTEKTLTALLGRPVSKQKKEIRAPGMHHLHYAPTTRAQLVKRSELAEYLHSLPQFPVACMVVGQFVEKVPLGVKIINMPDEAKAYAHDLYHTLRSLDDLGLQQIIIEMVPAGLEWEAIRDRLKKATAERA